MEDEVRMSRDGDNNKNSFTFLGQPSEMGDEEKRPPRFSKQLRQQADKMVSRVPFLMAETDEAIQNPVSNKPHCHDMSTTNINWSY
ncbi:conserved hypothetical protein [Ricinus communis]|uniref:Uncharacterized protein n=1 Tax=Ricinus communis TaxID=3988 RepID=B9T7V4_RICCO|nr:conserved hypothetical protein [Ricinus communis]